MESGASTELSSVSALLDLPNNVTSNRAIAERCGQVWQAKREARQRSIQAVNERNYQLKSILGNNSPVAKDKDNDRSLNNDTKLYQIKVLVCEELRQELKLTGREKRGRVFVERDGAATRSLVALRSQLHGFFRALKKDSYVLSAGYPASTLAPCLAADVLQHDNGTTCPADVLRHDNGTNANHDTLNDRAVAWPLECDNDVVESFRRADEFFASSVASSSSSESMKRPTLVVHVTKNPNAPPPPPVPDYLVNLPDPAESTHMTMLSFYAFPASGIANPDDYAVLLRKRWKPFSALGRVYVAHEGVNAQMSVPTLVLDRFVACCHDLPDQVGAYLQANGGINVDPVALTRQEFAVAGIPAVGAAASTTPAPPFTNLHIRVRQQVVTDGLEQAYDWQNAGTPNTLKM
jgi:UPF0176 acylphosphatase like domain